MKNLLITIIIGLTSLMSYSQTENEIDLFQASFGMQKDELVSTFVNPSETEKAPFLKLYNEYEIKRKTLGKETIKLLKLYSEEQKNLTNEQADSFMKSVIDLKSRRDGLLNSYYKKIKKATSAKVAAQFYQVEMFVLTSTRAAIYNKIPFVGDHN